MSSQFFLDFSLSNNINCYSNFVDKRIVIVNFHLDLSQMYLEKFMEIRNYFKLIKNNTCFKGPRLCIENKCCFQVLPHLK